MMVMVCMSGVRAKSVPPARPARDEHRAQRLRRTARAAHRLRRLPARARSSVWHERRNHRRQEDAMATKAQQFREETIRPHIKQATQRPHAEPRLTHNEAHRLDSRKAYALEATGKHRSRKSTRGGANHNKPDSALRITARIRNASPKARAGRKSGNPM
jgi:hypothetical protein